MSFRMYRVWLFMAILIKLSSCIEEEDPTESAAVLNDEQIQQYIRDNGLEDEAEGTDSGLYYIINEANPNGQSINEGDSVYVHFKASTLEGTVVDSTADFPEGSGREDRLDGFLTGFTFLIAGLDEGIRLLREGEKATLLIPSYLGFDPVGFPTALPKIPPFSVLIYEIEIVEVLSEEEQIEEFIASNNYTVDEVTSSGVSLVRFLNGSPNTTPEESDLITATFVGNFLSGEEFDSNTDSVFTVVIAGGDVIPGFDEALQFMNAGDSVIAIIPSEQAYGTTGQRDQGGNLIIPPFTPIAFQLTHVKSEDRQISEYISVNGITDTTSTDSGLFSEVLQVGGGATPSESSEVNVIFDAFYYRDKDSSLVQFEFGRNLTFTLGADNDPDLTNDGLEEGIQLMQVGERRRLMVPSRIGFGILGRSFIPGRTPIIYEVQLVSIL